MLWARPMPNWLLLDVLAVVALAVGQAEQVLLQDGVLAVPEGDGEAEPALAVGDPQQAVLAPAVGPRRRLGEREVAPGVAAGRVVLADGAPLPLRQVRAPVLPVARAGPPPPGGGARRPAAVG